MREAQPLLLDEREHRTAEADHAEDRAHAVDRHAAPRVDGAELAQQHERHNDRQDVQSEDVAPRARIDEQTADDRTRDRRRPCPGGPRADGAPLSGAVHGRDDEREGAGDQDRARRALEHPRHDQHLRRGREGAEQRGDTEADEADRHAACPPDPIGERARHQDERAERDEVAVHHPLLNGEPAAELPRDRGQRHGDDRAVEEGDEGGEDRHDENRPAARRGGVGSGGHARTRITRSPYSGGTLARAARRTQARRLLS